MAHRPIFVVGSPNEASRLEDMGLIAQTEGDAANEALRLSFSGTTAIVLLEDKEAASFIDACREAGAPVRRPAADTMAAYKAVLEERESWGSILGMLKAEEADAVNEAEMDRLAAADEQLKRLGVYNLFEVSLALESLEYVREPVPTGLTLLDEALGGGIPQGALTVLGAGSSSGKTTLLVQIADAMAAAGTPVLFVTIEQSRYEIVSKSLSRMMRLTDNGRGGYYPASTQHIQSKKERERWPKDKTEALNSCAARYVTTVGRNMRIMEAANGQPTVAQIRKAAEAMCRHDGRAPVVFIDYLQLVAPKDERMDMRRAVDYNVMALRQMAREMETPVVVISSIGRAAYYESAGLESFKESGGIEFSADVAMVLQPRGWAEKVRAKRGEKEQREAAREAMAQHRGSSRREVEICILKNRGGAMPQHPVPLDFDAFSCLFTCDMGAAEKQVQSKGRKVL